MANSPKRKYLYDYRIRASSSLIVFPARSAILTVLAVSLSPAFAKLDVIRETISHTSVCSPGGRAVGVSKASRIRGLLGYTVRMLSRTGLLKKISLKKCWLCSRSTLLATAVVRTVTVIFFPGNKVACTHRCRTVSFRRTRTICQLACRYACAVFIRPRYLTWILPQQQCSDTSVQIFFRVQRRTKNRIRRSAHVDSLQIFISSLIVDVCRKPEVILRVISLS